MRALLLCAVALAAAGCKHGKTTPPTCVDRLHDGDESDVDCGGAVCPGCVAGRACVAAHDCLSRICGADGRCAAESCADGVRTGSESDVDCGGPDCTPCDDGLQCAGFNDCKSHVCVGATCAAPSCGDGFQNGDESGIDCGGSCPPCDAAAGGGTD